MVIEGVRASVVLDASSYAHRIGERHGKKRIDVDLLALRSLLEAYGFEVVDLSVAAPLVAVELGPDSNGHGARRIVQRCAKWWRSQSRSWQEAGLDPGQLRILPGGFDGTREVGVDLMVAAGALDCIGRGWSAEPAEVVVVCSHDSDLYHLYRYSHRVPVLMCGSFSGDERVHLEASLTPHVEVDRDDLAGTGVGVGARGAIDTVRTQRMGEGGTARTIRKWISAELQPGDLVAVDRRDGGCVRSTSLNRPSTHGRVPYRPLTRARTVAVVDPYGLMNAAIASIGVDRLPSADAVRDLVSFSGWDSPIAVYATIPDLDRHSAGRLEAALGKAWRSRDAELDELAHAFDSDHDPLTQTQRARLKAPLDTPQGFDATRASAALAVKRLATGLLCDLWLAEVTNPEAAPVLISDDPDLALVLDLLPAAGIDTYRDVVRVGVHARRYKVCGDERPRHMRETTPRHSSQFLVLTESQLASLVGVQDSPHGTVLRRLLHHAVQSVVPWRDRGIDPESGALSVTTSVRVDTDGDSEPEQHKVGALLVPVGVEVNRTLLERIGASGEESFRLDMRFDPARPCAHPTLAALSAATGKLREATVMGHRGAVIDVDIDGDGLPDETISVGHGSRAFTASTTVVIERDPNTGCWNLVDPGPYCGEPLEPELVRMVDDGPAWPTMEPVEGGPAGMASPPLGCEAIRGEPGDVYLAVRTGNDSRTIWMVLSSPLHHLRNLLTD